MKKCLASRYIKKADLQPEENERILQDLFAFNSMKRTSFLWQRQRRKFLKEEKISEKAVKDQRIDHQTYERSEETIERICKHPV